MRGRKRRPTAVNEALGVYDHDPQRRNDAEPDAPDGMPTPPDDLDEAARVEWFRICGDLDSLGILSPAYYAAIRLYCESFSRYLEAKASVKKLGMVLATKNSKGQVEVRRNPASTDLHKYRDACAKFLVEFGLTPSAKSRVTAERLEQADPLDEFLSDAG